MRAFEEYNGCSRPLSLRGRNIKEDRKEEEGRMPAWELLEIVAGYLGGWVHKTEAGDVHILHLLLIIMGMTLITSSEHH